MLDPKLRKIKELLEEVPETRNARGDLIEQIRGVLLEPEEGEVGRVDVSGLIPGPMMAVFALDMEVSFFNHDQLGIILELAFGTPGPGVCKVLLQEGVAPIVATGIIDGATAAQKALDEDRIAEVTGKLWTPGD